ncbi:hypothetical protein SJAG_00517 [Schizosaccharomyces japonicus yFS275]|uniref:Uncharacterized protein n=1 Tax=Schizosaccharomyces japonicus (strain yFS275 / FY16936) TaxID=402676 RepID=B6JVV1_SCHJY|nr:hypothetical protein SJAG_00517 [Schizosaccharomyces japonicus yFS275]EEB05502.1 hypothetical protein SJAG_00517 [Schizosaccharomyces japonicus yFS275]
MQLFSFTLILIQLCVFHWHFATASPVDLAKRHTAPPPTSVLQTLYSRYWSFLAHVNSGSTIDAQGLLIHQRDGKLYIGEVENGQLLRVQHQQDHSLQLKDKQRLVYEPGSPVHVSSSASSEFLFDFLPKRLHNDSPYVLLAEGSDRFSACKEDGEWVLYSGKVGITDTVCESIRLVGLRYKNWKLENKKPKTYAQEDDVIDTPWDDRLIQM